MQTTGIPALHNGNNISSGLKIGTNNARSLTFETNNVNRGRFDSIGRFHVYNIPTATDTFITTINSDGLFTKTGKTSIVDTNTLSTKANAAGLVQGKQNTITTGTTAQYFRGDLSLATFPTNNTSFTNGAGYTTASSTTTFTNKRITARVDLPHQVLLLQ